MRKINAEFEERLIFLREDAERAAAKEIRAATSQAILHMQTANSRLGIVWSEKVESVGVSLVSAATASYDVAAKSWFADRRQLVDQMNLCIGEFIDTARNMKTGIRTDANGQEVFQQQLDAVILRLLRQTEQHLSRFGRSRPGWLERFPWASSLIERALFVAGGAILAQAKPILLGLLALTGSIWSH